MTSPHAVAAKAGWRRAGARAGQGSAGKRHATRGGLQPQGCTRCQLHAQVQRWRRQRQGRRGGDRQRLAGCQAMGSSGQVPPAAGGTVRLDLRARG